MKKLLILLALGILVTGSIYAENEGPSDVYVDSSTNILMLKKPTDSSYQQFTIKGVNWSPATQSPQTGIIYDATTPYGFFFNWPNRWPQGHEVMRYWQRNELFEHYVKDIPLISGMNANTVRILNNLGSTLEDYEKFTHISNQKYPLKEVLSQP